MRGISQSIFGTWPRSFGCIIVLTVAGFGSGPGASAGAACLDFTQYNGYVGRIPVLGQIFDLGINANTLIAASIEMGVVAIDVTDASKPRVLGSAEVPGYPIALTLEGPHAYVMESLNGLHVFDVGASRRAIPMHLATMALPGTGIDGSLENDLLAVALFDDGFALVDVTDRTNPTLVGGYESEEFLARALILRGGLVYVAGAGTGFWIFDVSDPHAPRQLSRITPSTSSIQDVALTGNYALLTTYSAGVLIVDIRDPENPSVVQGWDQGHSWDRIAATGSEAVVLSIDNHQMAFLDVTQPNTPQLVSTLRVEGAATAFAVHQGSIYVGNDWRPGISIYRLEESPHDPPSTQVNELRSAASLFVESNLGCASLGDDGAQLFDVSNLKDIRLLGSIPAVSQTTCSFIKHNLLYIGDYDSGLLIFDISDPFSPREIAHHPLRGIPRKIAIVDDTLYLANHWGGFVLYDVSDPTTLVPLAEAAVGAGCHDFELRGSHAFLCCRTGGIQIWDVGNPRAPVEIFRQQLPGYVYDGALVDRAFCVVNREDQLFSFDVSNPCAPIPGTPMQAPVFASSLEASDTTLLIGASMGVCAIDFADPLNPKHISSVSTDEHIYSVLLHDDFMLVSTYDGLVAFTAPCASETVHSLFTLNNSYSPRGIEFRSPIVSEDESLAYSLQRSGAPCGPFIDVPTEARIESPEVVLLDPNPVPQSAFYYRAIGRGPGGIEKASVPIAAVTPVWLASKIQFTKPFPNPSSGTVSSSFILPRPTNCRLTIHDVAGRRVKTIVSGRRPEGVHEFTWDGTSDLGRSVAPGVYWMNLAADGEQASERLVRLR